MATGLVAIREIGRDEDERLLLQGRHRLGHGREIVEHICPQAPMESLGFFEAAWSPYSNSTRYSTLATSPASLIPSTVARL